MLCRCISVPSLTPPSRLPFSPVLGRSHPHQPQALPEPADWPGGDRQAQWGHEYKGILVSVDSYMNLQTEAVKVNRKCRVPQAEVSEGDIQDAGLFPYPRLGEESLRYWPMEGPEPAPSHRLPRTGKPCRPEGHPHFGFLLQGACQSHCQDNIISVNCAAGDLVAIVSRWAACNISGCGLLRGCKEPGLQYLGGGGLLKPIISFSDDQLLVCKLE
ncbi:hypothetical protein GWK47_003359 [Chionoecetes opilio]|uniref:LSM domain-containing protein n=1 Tax=Chionoecetes opilio TaxID=41210 RepID=A0A8J4YSS4_CHIOP|nr:hypothetical protein GWK47_003359 [Chionoecetes opilio]